MIARRGILTAIVAAAMCPVLDAQQQYVLFVSLLDKDGNPPAALTAEQVRLTENGAALNVLRVDKVDWPVKLHVLVDNGVGLGSQNLIHLRNGVRELMKTLPAGVEASLYTTAPQARPIVRPTNDKLALVRGADLIAPDLGAGRYIESLNEATQRIERDESNHFPVIIAVATAAGDSNVQERQVDQLWKRLHQRPTTVHTVMLSGAQSLNTVAGANQTQVGIATSELTRGRYENIVAPSRLATLLPEIGEQVAESHRRQSRQFRVVFERSRGVTGPLGEIGGSLPAGYTVQLTTDGAMP
jgi:hypothetical protein